MYHSLTRMICLSDLREQLKEEGKPADMIDKIAQGKIGKALAEVTLLEQPSIMDDSKKERHTKRCSRDWIPSDGLSSSPYDIISSRIHYQKRLLYSHLLMKSYELVVLIDPRLSQMSRLLSVRRLIQLSMASYRRQTIWVFSSSVRPVV